MDTKKERKKAELREYLEYLKMYMGMDKEITWEFSGKQLAMIGKAIDQFHENCPAKERVIYGIRKDK